MGIFPLLYVVSIVLWLKWPRVLVISVSSGPIGYFHGGFEDLGSLDAFWHLVKSESSFQLSNTSLDTGRATLAVLPTDVDGVLAYRVCWRS